MSTEAQALMDEDSKGQASTIVELIHPVAKSTVDFFEFRMIYTNFAVSNLHEINTSSRTFECDVEVTLHWALTEKEKSKVLSYAFDKNKLNDYLTNVQYPQLLPLNARNVNIAITTQPAVKVSTIRDKNGAFQFFCVQQISGEWSMNRDNGQLDDFPFDYQILPIDISTKTGDTDRFRINTPKDNPFKSSSVQFLPCESQEFDCYMAELYTMICPDPTRQEYTCGITCIIQAKRKWRYYFNQVVIFVFLLSCMVLPTYSIGVREISDRLSHLTTLLLSQTVLLYFVGTSLPKLTHFSHLDEYLIWNWVITLGCAVQCSITSLIEDDDTAVKTDQVFCFVCIGVFVLINVVYICKALMITRKNNNNRFKTTLNPCNYYNKVEDGFVKPDYSEYTDYNIYSIGGPCVYYKHLEDWKDEYRDWQSENEEVDINRVSVLDYVVVLFGEIGAWEADLFYQNGLESMRATRKQNLSQLSKLS